MAYINDKCLSWITLEFSSNYPLRWPFIAWREKKIKIHQKPRAYVSAEEKSIFRMKMFSGRLKNLFAFDFPVEPKCSFWREIFIEQSSSYRDRICSSGQEPLYSLWYVTWSKTFYAENIISFAIFTISILRWWTRFVIYTFCSHFSWNSVWE